MPETISKRQTKPTRFSLCQQTSPFSQEKQQGKYRNTNTEIQVPQYKCTIKIYKPGGGREQFLGAPGLPPGGTAREGGAGRQRGDGELCPELKKTIFLRQSIEMICGKPGNKSRPDLFAELCGGGKKEDGVDHELAARKYFKEKEIF